MDAIQKNLLEQVAGLHEMPAGAYNIRANGHSVERSTTAHIDIVTKTDKQGIDILIKPGTKNESVQIKGVDSTRRTTSARLADGARLVVTEKLMTHGSQTAETSFLVDLDGDGSSANIISRSVARDDSRQLFLSRINGRNRCKGHSECDGIIMDRAVISAVPEITAIGKIAGEQIIKLMTLGLTEAEAEEQIINGFLK